MIIYSNNGCVLSWSGGATGSGSSSIILNNFSNTATTAGTGFNTRRTNPWTTTFYDASGYYGYTSDSTTYYDASGYYGYTFADYTTFHYDDYNSFISQITNTPPNKEQKDLRFKNRIKEIIQQRCSPNFFVQNSKRKPLEVPKDIREQRARETLRCVIGEQKFINFIKNGFISVKAKSGYVYQIFPGNNITHVFDQGKLIERLCVVLKGNFPPTDSLIMRYLLILNNENQFRSLAIKHGIIQQTKSEKKSETKSLIEIFKELKAAS